MATTSTSFQLTNKIPYIMTGRELIKLIEQTGVQDFEIEVRLFEADGSNYGAKLRVFGIDNKFGDIGYSDKIVSLALNER